MTGLALEELDFLLLVGVNRRRLPLDLGERLFGGEPDLPQLLADLAALQAREAMAIATSERLELLLARGGEVGLVEALLDLLAKHAGATASEIAASSYCHEGANVVGHVFAVTASLDSEVPGEPQILGRVRSCHGLAAQKHMTGPGLEALLQAAYGAAERIRRETPLAEQPVSMAASALQMARQLHGELSRCRALVIGLGEMGEILAGELTRAGVEDLVLIHPSTARAELSARRLGCHYRAWEDLPAALAQADILVSDQGSGRWTVTRDLAAAALLQRRRRPMFLIDVAVPRDIEAAVGDLADAFVYNLDDLERLALEGHADREAASERARRILEDERTRFLRNAAEGDAAPTETALHDHFEATRQAVLAESGGDAELATKLLIKRLLRRPTEALRQSAAEGADRKAGFAEAVRRLFRLNQDGGRDRPAGKEPQEEDR